MDASEKLWDLANLVTGFASAQSIAFIYGLVAGNLKMIKGRDAHWAAGVGTIVFTVIYIAAVVLCTWAGSGLSKDVPAYIWWCVTMGRALIIFLFAFLAVWTIRGHRREEVART